jgi:hypothetical protein
MDSGLNEEKIRGLAKQLDDAIEKHDVEGLVAFFSADCEVRLPGITLSGHEGLRRAIHWMYSHLGEIVLVPVTIIIQGNVFFEEFVVKARSSGADIEVRQAEVLVYDDEYKVKSIRLYFDRLELARSFSTGPIERLLVGMVSRSSLKGLQ